MASGGMYQSVIDFHAKVNKPMQAGIQRAKRVLTDFLEKLRLKLREREPDFNRYEYTGSVYEGLKIGDADEFDTMVIINKEKTLRVGSEIAAGYHQLKKKQDDSNLNAEDTVHAFFSILRKCVDSLNDAPAGLVLRRHGPAVQIDVEDVNGAKFSVDMVLGFQVEGRLFVAKSPEEAALPAGITGSSIWRQSFSLEEKAKLTGIDSDQGCRMMVLRVLKGIRERDAPLQALASFHLKTLLFHECDKTASADWRKNYIHIRLQNILLSLERFLEQQDLKNYFIPGMNLFSGLRSVVIQNMKNRVSKLARNDAELIRVFNR